jgi:hypothetical protein
MVLAKKGLIVQAMKQKQLHFLLLLIPFTTLLKQSLCLPQTEDQCYARGPELKGMLAIVTVLADAWMVIERSQLQRLQETAWPSSLIPVPWRKPLQ